VPAVVARSARALRGSTGKYVFVSTISVYRDWPHSPVCETSPVWDGRPDEDPGTRTWDPDAYGPLKVGCELAVHQVFADDELLVLRPHVVVGPHEYVGRVPWWLRRMSRGGDVLVPGPDRPIQPVDVRDLATFTLDQIDNGASGVFNVAAPPERETFGDMLSACAEAVAVSPDTAPRFVWVDEKWLVAKGVTQWTELPLWRDAAAPWQMLTAKAQQAGLACRPLRGTIADTWAWMRGGGRVVPHERFAQHGIAPQREQHLLRDWADFAMTPAAEDSSRTHG
jgi:nucleoside-diphosphate-sugar epimerase